MIVPSMTFQEIHNEVFEDIKNIEKITNGFEKDFRKLVLRKSRYPLTKTYEYVTKENKNLFIIGYTALKRSDWDNPIIHFYGIYSRPEGKYVVAPTIDMNIITIYPPHFFKRYRERIVKDDTISNDDIIRLYFKNDWGLTGAKVNQDHENVYNSFEDDDKNERISIVAATSQGYCFGVKQGNINIIKTIISEEMLFENQKIIFHELRKAFNEMNKERYGKDI
ncbi:MAG: hypothetical protein WCL70_13930 [Paludibacter sp.]